MAKIKLRAGKEAVGQAESGGDFGDPPKPGLYHLKLEAIEERKTKGDSSRSYLNIRYRPVGIGREGTKPTEKLGSVWDVVSLTSEDAEWTRARFALALGAKPNRAGNVQLDVELDEGKPGNPVGTVVLGRVRRDEDLDGNYKPGIGWIGPLEATPESGDDDGFSDDDDDEGEATEPFEDEDEGEESELLSEEDLGNMENKELGAVAKDFDINTKDYVKKVKGKVQADRAGLIAAILEAQNGSEDDGDDDEDPF